MKRPNDYTTKVHYSDLCKSELHRSDRRVAGHKLDIFNGQYAYFTFSASSSWLIHYSAFISIQGHVTLDIRDCDTIPCSCKLIPGDLHVPMDRSTQYPAFKTVGLYCQTPIITHARHTGRQFIPFYETLV